MARNGSGTYSLVSGNPVVTGTTISSTWANNTLSDIATALTQSLAYDGQTVPVANLPMGSYRHTGVGNAVNLTDYAVTGQVQNSSYIWCGTAGGTANALTLTPTPAITAYAAGQRFFFKAGASASTSTVTVAISGLGTIAVQSNGSALSGGEIAANKWYQILLDTTSTCQLLKMGFPTPTEIGAYIDPMTTRGDIVVRNSSNVTARLAIGAAGTVLYSDGTDVAWSNTPKSKTNAKAWVCFDGSTGTIKSSHNVTSVTRSAGGQYSIAFTSNLADANYAVAQGAGRGSGGFTGNLIEVPTNAQSVSGFNCFGIKSSDLSLQDIAFMSLIVFGT